MFCSYLDLFLESLFLDSQLLLVFAFLLLLQLFEVGFLSAQTLVQGVDAVLYVTVVRRGFWKTTNTISAGRLVVFISLRILTYEIR